MKIRNGFVSNSSSSSFVVIRQDRFGKNKKKLISDKDEKLLTKFGFKKTDCSYPDGVDITSETNDSSFNYGYSVSCNQDEIIYFLLKNNIPFKASCHYNHYNVIYSRNDKFFLEIQNYGEQAIMYHDRKELFGEFGVDTKEPVKKVNIKEWLKREGNLEKEFEKIEKDSIIATIKQKDAK